MTSSPSPSPSPKTRWSRMVRRTSAVLSISRTNTPSITSDRDPDTASLSDSIIKGPPLKAHTFPTTNPSPIAESPIREAAAIAQEVVATSPLTQSATSSEEVPPKDSFIKGPPLKAHTFPNTNPSPISESPIHQAAAIAQEVVATFPLTQPATSSEEVSPKPTTLSPVSELQSPIGYVPPPVLDSSRGNPGAFTDGLIELPQPNVVKDPYAVAVVEPNTEPATGDAPELVSTVEPHVEPTTIHALQPVPVQPETAEDLHVVAAAAVETHVPVIVDAPEPVTVVPDSTLQYEPEPGAMFTEEPTSYFDEPLVESIKDFEPSDHVNNVTVFTEAVYKDINASLPEPDYGNGEAAEYYRGQVVVVSTTSRAVHENVNTVLPGPDFAKVEAEAVDNHSHVIAVTTTTERKSQQEEATESISMPIPVPTYEVSSYPMNLGSGQEVWGGEHNYERQGILNPYENAYPSSVVPVIIPISEDLKPVERTPSVRFVHFFLSLVGLDSDSTISSRMSEDPFTNPIAPRTTVSHPEVHMPQ